MDAKKRGRPLSEARRTEKLTLAITPEDKKTLKVMAIEQDTTVAELIHVWILEHTNNK
jgi:hypothetical protein